MAGYEQDDWDVYDEPSTSYAVRHGKGPLGSYNPTGVTTTITTKIPPSFDGSQSWFAYETAIDEWVDLTELSEEKQGPALRARLEGEAARIKEFLGRDRLKQKNGRGVAYFKETLRAHFLKSSQVVFLWRFLKFFEMRRRNEDFHPWLTKIALAFKKLQESWGDVFEPYAKDSPEFTAARLLNAPLSAASSVHSDPFVFPPTAKAKAKVAPKEMAAAAAPRPASTIRRPTRGRPQRRWSRGAATRAR